MSAVKIALVGDRNDAHLAHRMIPRSLEILRDDGSPTLAWSWVPTERIGDPERSLASFDGIWCVPASPYRDAAGALSAIRFARESRRPFLGTCGGFQHAVIEYARNVAGISDAANGEESPDSPHAVITALSCSLVEKSGEIHLQDGSRIREICGVPVLREGYHCNYGVDAGYELELEGAGLSIAGRGPEGEPRAVELPEHPFFLATLFQPERAAVEDCCHLLVRAFVRAAAKRVRGAG